MTATQRMTFQDLMAQPDDGYLHELVRGEIVRMPPPKTIHGYIEAALVGAIDRYLHQSALAKGWTPDQGRAERDRLVGRPLSGEAGVRVSVPDDPDQTRGLDVGYLSPDQVARLEGVSEDDYITEVPVLVAEVISASERADYVQEKLTDYLAGGARIVWLLYPRTRSVMVFRADGTSYTVPADGTLDGDDVLPGFAERLSNIFA